MTMKSGTASTGRRGAVRARHRVRSSRLAVVPPRRPRTAPECAICADTAHEIVCSAAQVRAQLEYVRDFHRRRLRPHASPAALADRADFTQGDAVALVRCAGCGHLFRAARPSAAAATDEYAHDTYGEERLGSLFDAQRRFFRAKLPQVAERLRGGSGAPTVVEIGSFVGGFLAAAGERGWPAVGVDPGAEVVHFARRQGLTVHRGTAADAPIAARAADCVAIWNTFDQLPDPRPTLAAARRWLRPGGLVVVRIPNGAAFAAAMRLLPRLPAWGRAPLHAALAWNNLLGFPYLHGYTLPTLDRLLGEVGLQRVTHHAQTLVPLADANTRRWAVCEEWLLKAAWRALIQRAARQAPWLDVYYRG